MCSQGRTTDSGIWPVAVAARPFLYLEGIGNLSQRDDRRPPALKPESLGDFTDNFGPQVCLQIVDISGVSYSQPKSPPGERLNT